MRNIIRGEKWYTGLHLNTDVGISDVHNKSFLGQIIKSNIKNKFYDMSKFQQFHVFVRKSKKTCQVNLASVLCCV